MATYRIGIGSFNLKDGAVGIGTESSGLGNLKVEGTYKTTDLDVTGVSTFTRYAGFAADDINIISNVSLTGEHSSTGDIVVGVNSTFTVSTGATVDVGKVENVSIGTHFSVPIRNYSDISANNYVTNVEYEKVEVPVEGSVRFNEDIRSLEFYDGVEWRQFTFSGASGRAVWAGGYRTGGTTASIDSIQIPTQGNSVKFGELNAGGQDAYGCGNAIRGLFAGSINSTNAIDYITIQSAGNAIDFGDLASKNSYCGAHSSSTRGIWAGGNTDTTIIQFVEIMTLGNATDFGTLTIARQGNGGVFGSPTRGFTGGNHPSYSPSYDMFSIQSGGNAVNFGELMSSYHYQPAGFSNTIRGVLVAGTSAPGVYHRGIQTIIMSSGGNAVEFGDPVVAGQGSGGKSTATRGVYGRGRTPGDSSVLEMIDMQSGGQAECFGDLRGKADADSYSRHIGPCGDSHGGLGGY